ncbi:unnamed protein product [Echinostoma caproni]|uniref:ABC transmembrane type-1 domain-containing protein n=1 Tax=Echinostoma caproni TaxID=27848 RepID=A0A183B1I4_9TREM|nr:unnamed protein product [Echinostoma caproni]
MQNKRAREPTTKRQWVALVVVVSVAASDSDVDVDLDVDVDFDVDAVLDADADADADANAVAIGAVDVPVLVPAVNFKLVLLIGVLLPAIVQLLVSPLVLVLITGLVLVLVVVLLLPLLLVFVLALVPLLALTIALVLVFALVLVAVPVLVVLPVVVVVVVGVFVLVVGIVLSVLLVFALVLVSGDCDCGISFVGEFVTSGVDAFPAVCVVSLFFESEIFNCFSIHFDSFGLSSSSFHFFLVPFRFSSHRGVFISLLIPYVFRFLYVGVIFPLHVYSVRSFQAFTFFPSLAIGFYLLLLRTA